MDTSVMRNLLARLVLLFALASCANAQYAPSGNAKTQRPIALSGYLTLGFESHYAIDSGSLLIVTVGVQGEWTRWRFRPGLDLRTFGNADAVHGGLAGPSVALYWKGLRPYAEALFGANSNATNYSTTPPTSQQGVTSEVVVGLDLDVSPHTRWRVLEFSQGAFTGSPDSYPRTLSSGIVLHF